MRKRIETVLVNLVSIVDVLLIRCFNRKKHITNKKIVLVRLDAIGDFVMWLSAAKVFKENYAGEIVLICNQVCRDLAVNTGYFDEVIGVNYAKLRHTSQIKYRWSIHRILQDVKAEKAIQCTYSKEIFSDMVMSAVMSDIKITIDSPKVIQMRWTYRWTKNIYQQIVDTPIEHLMEVHRNVFFAGNVLGKTVQSEMPYIKENENAQDKILSEKYFVIFPGASETERMWHIERFAETVAKLHEKEKYKFLKCCLCGSKDEAYLGEKFRQLYADSDKIVDIMGKTTLPELIEIIRGAEFLITNDTSAVHFAAAVNTKAFCIWGPWEYGRFLPYKVDKIQGRNLPIVCYHEQSCRNCLLDGTDKTKECKQFIEAKGIRKCIADVTVEDVIKKIMDED